MSKTKLALIHLYWRLFNKKKYGDYLCWLALKSELAKKRKNHDRTKDTLYAFQIATVAYDFDLTNWRKK